MYSVQTDTRAKRATFHRSDLEPRGESPRGRPPRPVRRAEPAAVGGERSELAGNRRPQGDAKPKARLSPRRRRANGDCISARRTIDTPRSTTRRRGQEEDAERRQKPQATRATTGQAAEPPPDRRGRATAAANVRRRLGRSAAAMDIRPPHQGRIRQLTRHGQPAILDVAMFGLSSRSDESRSTSETIPALHPG